MSAAVAAFDVLRAHSRAQFAAAMAGAESAAGAGLVSVSTTVPQGSSVPLHWSERCITIDRPMQRVTNLRKQVGVGAKLLHNMGLRPGMRAENMVMVTLTYAGTNANWRPEHISDYIRKVRKWFLRNCPQRSLRYVWVAALRPGDVLVVWKIDRMARSLSDLLNILKRLKGMGAGLRSLTEPIDTSTAIGEFLLQVLGAVAQLERSMIRERVIAGQVAAIVRGAKHGRPKMLSEADQAIALDMRRSGMGKPTIAKLYGVSRGVIDRIVAQAADPNHKTYGPKRPVLGPLLDAAAL